MFVGDACHATRNSTEPERKESANRTQRQGSAKRRSVQNQGRLYATHERSQPGPDLRLLHRNQE